MGTSSLSHPFCPSKSASPIPLFIVGLQKSGTSLLNRCLQMDAAVSSPFRAEGHDFWGDIPPFTPTAYPAGTLYQAAGGKRGHLLNGADVDRAMIATIRRRWNELPHNTPIILNKNPYNTLRLEWLRVLFPEARIIAMVRNPLANTYSLTKKYVPHQGRGKEPEEGWWGIKPPHWQKLVNSDKVRQSASQWAAIHQILLAQANLIDLFVPYDKFCQHPSAWLSGILKLCQPDRFHPPPSIPPLRNCDEEYRLGSRFRSNNRYFRERGDLSLPAQTIKEYPPFTRSQMSRIEILTLPLWRELCRHTSGGAFKNCSS